LHNDLETGTVVSSWIVRLDPDGAAEGREFLAAMPAMRLREVGGVVVLTAECPKGALTGLHQRIVGTPGVISVSLVAAYDLEPMGPA
jgi:hypothetical protein